MKDLIFKHLKERDEINVLLNEIMGYADDSPINIEFFDKSWGIVEDELHLAVEGDDLEDDCYVYELSSMGAKGEEFFMGEKDGTSYVMAYSDNWTQTQIFILNTKNRIE
jgi:hypothetical protein